jgi:4-hydroxy-2-oxoheptanedioate aldolase
MPSRMQQKWAKKQLTTVFGLGQFCGPKYIELIGVAGGWDGVWLDQEHAGLTIDNIADCTRAARLPGLDCFVRVAPTDYATIMRPLEVGAHGVMAAQIRSVEQAAAVIEWSRFYPQGLRGVNSSGCDGAFGTIPMAQYMKQANDETYIILQVEHFAAVEAVEKIAALKHLGGLFIGPADLSQSMGLPGQIDHPDVVKAIERVAKASRASGVPWSILPKDAALAKRCVGWGCSMLSLGNDNVALHRGLMAYHGEYEWLQK